MCTCIMNLSWVSIGFIRICAAVIGRSTTASSPQAKDFLAQDSQAPGLQIQAGINRVIPIISFSSSAQYTFAPHSLFRIDSKIKLCKVVTKKMVAGSMCSSKMKLCKLRGRIKRTAASLELYGHFKL